jgi:hypothetical protein
VLSPARALPRSCSIDFHFHGRRSVVTAGLWGDICAHRCCVRRRHLRSSRPSSVDPSIGSGGRLGPEQVSSARNQGQRTHRGDVPNPGRGPACGYKRLAGAHQRRFDEQPDEVAGPRARQQVPAVLSRPLAAVGEGSSGQECQQECPRSDARSRPRTWRCSRALIRGCLPTATARAAWEGLRNPSSYP